MGQMAVLLAWKKYLKQVWYCNNAYNSDNLEDTKFKDRMCYITISYLKKRTNKLNKHKLSKLRKMDQKILVRATKQLI